MAILEIIDSTDMCEPERKGLKHSVEIEFELAIAEIEKDLARERFPDKGYCPVWDNAYDYALRQVSGIKAGGNPQTSCATFSLDLSLRGRKKEKDPK